MRRIKTYKSFENNSYKYTFLEKELFKHEGWDNYPPEYRHWEEQWEYDLSKNTKIMLIKFRESNFNVNYYMVDKRINDGDSIIFISPYDGKINLFKEIDDNYERMMKICNYLLPYFEKKPDDNLIDEIREYFLEIEDILGTPRIEWGYSKNNRIGAWFPANDIDEKLSLVFKWSNAYGKELYDKSKDEFEYIKDRLISSLEIENVYFLNELNYTNIYLKIVF